jgi:hypothetical protein
MTRSRKPPRPLTVEFFDGQHWPRVEVTFPGYTETWGWRQESPDDDTRAWTCTREDNGLDEAGPLHGMAEPLSVPARLAGAGGDAVAPTPSENETLLGLVLSARLIEALGGAIPCPCALCRAERDGGAAAALFLELGGQPKP